MRIFLSYARADAQAEAQTLRDQLNDARRVTWLDRHDIDAGADWWESARRAIIDSSAFVLLITPASVASDAVKKEYELALALQKHFIPILVKPIAPALPPAIINRNYRDLTNDYGAGLAKLIGDLEKAWEDVSQDLTRLAFDDGSGACLGAAPSRAGISRTRDARADRATPS